MMRRFSYALGILLLASAHQLIAQAQVTVPPAEPWRKNADDRVILVIQLKQFPDYVPPPAVSALPEWIA